MFKKVLSDSVVYGMSRILMMAVSMFLVPIYSRMLTKADYGIMDTFNSLSNILVFVLTTGVSQAIYRFIYELNDDEKKKYYSTVYLYFWCLTLFFTGIAYMLRYPVSHLLIRDNNHTRIFMASIIIACCSALTSLNLDICRSQFKKISYIVLSVGNALMLAALGIIFVAILKLGVIGFFYAGLITQIFILTIGTIINRNSLMIYFSSPIMSKIFNFGLPFLPAAVGTTLMRYVDRIVLLRMLPVKSAHDALESLGTYSMSLRIASVFELVGIAFSTAWYPWAMRVANQDDAKAIYSNMFNNIIILFVILGGLFNSVQIFILYIFAAHKFNDSYQYVYLMTFSSIVMYTSYVLSLGITITKNTKYISVPTIVSGIVNVALCIPLAKMFGIAGVNVSLVFMSATYVYLGYYFSNKYYPINFHFLRNISMLGVLGIWLLAIYLDDRYFISHLLINISIKIVLMVFFISAFYFLNSDFRQKSTAVLQSLIQKYATRNTVAPSESS